MTPGQPRWAQAWWVISFFASKGTACLVPFFLPQVRSDSKNEKVKQIEVKLRNGEREVLRALGRTRYEAVP